MLYFQFKASKSKMSRYLKQAEMAGASSFLGISRTSLVPTSKEKNDWVTKTICVKQAIRQQEMNTLEINAFLF